MSLIGATLNFDTVIANEPAISVTGFAGIFYHHSKLVVGLWNVCDRFELMIEEARQLKLKKRCREEGRLIRHSICEGLFQVDDKKPYHWPSS